MIYLNYKQGDLLIMSEILRPEKIEGLTPQEYYEAGFRFAVNFLHAKAKNDFGPEFQQTLRRLINMNMSPGVEDEYFKIHPYFEVNGYPAGTCPVGGGHVECGGLSLTR